MAVRHSLCPWANKGKDQKPPSPKTMPLWPTCCGAAGPSPTGTPKPLVRHQCNRMCMPSPARAAATHSETARPAKPPNTLRPCTMRPFRHIVDRVPRCSMFAAKHEGSFTGIPCRMRAKIVCHRPPDRRCVKLLRMLSPHAELSSTSKTSAALTALFCLLRFPAGPGSASSGLGGRLSADANCQSPSAGGEKGDICGDDRDGDSGAPRVGDPSGVACIEFARLRNVMSFGGVGARASLPEARQSVGSIECRSTGENSGLPLAEYCPRCASVMSSSSTKISGTVNCGTAVMRPDFLCSTARRNRRDQYNVSKNPITTLRRTASSTRCRRALRRKNSSNLRKGLVKI